MASFFPPSESPSVTAPLLDQLSSPRAEDHSTPPDAAPVDEQDRGVTRIESLYRTFGSGSGLAPIWTLYFSIGLISFAYSLSASTVRSFLVFATSAFNAHSLLGSIEVAIYILGAVAKPFIAKLSDITSRPIAYLVSLAFYVLGFVIVASSHSIQAVAAGELFYTIGNTGISLVTEILVADISPLKWRGLMTALPGSPYIINAFISGYIVDGFGAEGWRWGYGIFAIIMPTVMAPALIILFWADIQAKRLGTLSISTSSYAGRIRAEQQQTWFQLWASWWSQIDAFGLIILGISWAMVLLPLTLYKKNGEGWNAHSLIAMFIFGWALMTTFVLYEKYWAVHPMMPLRVLNRTFLCCVAIDVFYFMSGNMRSTYYSSWTYVVKDWTLRNWTFFTNIATVGLCIFGLMAGAIQRATHRYKYLQVTGLVIRIFGMGLTLHARGANATDAKLIWTQILISMGGAFSVVGSRVASQASVPHQDMATVIALLSLWTSLGGAIGSAIAAAVWTGTLPDNLTKQLSGKLTAKEILKIYDSTKVARNQPPDIRVGVIRAYDDTVYYMYLPALILSVIPLIAAFMTTDFLLGDNHNAIERKNFVVIDENEDGSEQRSDYGSRSSSPELEAWSPGGTTKRVVAAE